MTIEAARTLDQAFATYLTVAQHDDSSRISQQSPSWLPLTETAVAHSRHGESNFTMHRSTPYDFAAALCRSLLPYAYNYDPSLTSITYNIWEIMVDALEVLPFDHEAIKAALIDKNTPEPYTCDTCGWDVRSLQHFKECIK